MKCKLCLNDKKLIKSHIIPKSFYRPLMKDKTIPRLITDKIGSYPTKIRIGVYDKEIICEECERLFSPWDDYANEFFNQKLANEDYIIHKNKKIAYNFGNVEYKKLKLFFLSVLWRASVSSERMFSRVKLGKYEEKIKQLMLDNLEVDSNNFSIVIFKFENMNVDGFLDPDRMNFEGVNHYRLYLGEYMAVIKVSNQPDVKEFQGMYIKEGKDVICVFRDFNNSKEYKVMKSTSEKAWHNSNN